LRFHTAIPQKLPTLPVKLGEVTPFPGVSFGVSWFGQSWQKVTLPDRRPNGEVC
jgi:hypothetical protein